MASASGWSGRLRSGFVLGLLFAAVPAGGAEVTRSMSGQVVAVFEHVEGTRAALAERGVVEGGPVDVRFTLTEVDPHAQGEFTLYAGAILELEFRIGSYVARGTPEAAPELNTVEVGDDVRSGAVTADVYNLNVVGEDTDALLSGGEPLGLSLFCLDSEADASWDEGLIQDPERYGVASGVIVGQNGSLTVAFRFSLPEPETIAAARPATAEAAQPGGA